MEPTYEQYFESLDKTSQCEESSRMPGTFEWTPDENIPYIVFYQCYTHRGLGWQIRVFDQGVLGMESNLNTCRILLPSCFSLFFFQELIHLAFRTCY